METKILETIRYLKLEIYRFYYLNHDHTIYDYIEIQNNGRCVSKKLRDEYTQKARQIENLSGWEKEGILNDLKMRVSNKIKNDILGFELF